MDLGLTSKAVKRLIFQLIRPVDFKSLVPNSKIHYAGSCKSSFETARSLLRTYSQNEVLFFRL